MSELEEKVKDGIDPIITNLGYEIYDVIYEKEGKDNYLRIFIDNKNGISIEDCEKVNNAITDILDDKNYIKTNYFLEVSSPGVERRIRTRKHLEDNIEKEVEVHLYKQVENKKIIQGILKKFDDNSINIEVTEKKEETISKSKIKLQIGKSEEKKSKVIQIENKNISKINTTFDWNEN